MHPITHARLIARLLVLSAAIAAPAALADMVQGVVSPANASVEIKKGGQVVQTLGAGPFQVWLEPGDYVAECRSPNADKRIKFRSLSQTTDVNLDCS